MWRERVCLGKKWEFTHGRQAVRKQLKKWRDNQEKVRLRWGGGRDWATLFL